MIHAQKLTPQEENLLIEEFARIFQAAGAGSKPPGSTPISSPPPLPPLAIILLAKALRQALTGDPCPDKKPASPPEQKPIEKPANDQPAASVDLHAKQVRIAKEIQVCIKLLNDLIHQGHQANLITRIDENFDFRFQQFELIKFSIPLDIPEKSK